MQNKNGDAIQIISVLILVRAYRNILVVVTLLYGADLNVLAVIIVDLDKNSVADLSSHQSLAKRRLL